MVASAGGEVFSIEAARRYESRPVHASPQNWGGLFMMRTGSGVGPDGNTFNGFTPGIFGRWKKVSDGGRMTECMPTMTTGEQLWIPEEQDFFDLLEMDFVPPVERTSKNVIKKYIKK